MGPVGDTFGCRLFLVEGASVQMIRTAAALMIRSMVLSAQAAGQQRLLWLQQTAAVGGDVGEVARLQDGNRCGGYPAMEPALRAQVGQSMAAADGSRRSMRAASASMPMWDCCLACLGWSRRWGNPDDRETLNWAVPSPRNKDTVCCLIYCTMAWAGVGRLDRRLSHIENANGALDSVMSCKASLFVVVRDGRAT